MPIVKRFGSVSLRIYADDHHPPHVHIVAPDFQALARLTDFKVIAGDARPIQIAEALAWAKKNKALLMRLWNTLNERG